MSDPFNDNLITTEKTVDTVGFFKGLPELPHTREGCGYKDPQPSTNPHQMALEEQMAKYVGKLIRLTLSDGRRYQGVFYCYDWQGNIVINQVGRVNADGTIKHGGVAIVSYKDIVSISVRLG